MSMCGKLRPVSFGFSWGLISGLGWMILAWMGKCCAFGLPVLALMSSIYMGLAPTYVGGLWGLLWGFVDFFLFAFFTALVYNCCAKSCCSKSDGCCK